MNTNPNHEPTHTEICPACGVPKGVVVACEHPFHTIVLDDGWQWAKKYGEPTGKSVQPEGKEADTKN